MFRAGNPVRKFNDTLLTIPYSSHVWAPVTVVDSLVTTTLRTAILDVAGNSAADQQQARGRLCINSTEQAPAFSRWKRCGLNTWWSRWIYGPEQSSDQLTISEKP